MKQLRVGFAALLAAGVMWGQEGIPQGGGAQGGGGGAPSPSPGVGTPGGAPIPDSGRRTTTPFPTDQQQRFPEIQRPIFLSGKVVMEDGTPPPEPVVIERLCSAGNARPEGYTDSKGRFSFELGRNQGMFADASVDNSDPLNRQGGFGAPGRGGNTSLGGMPGMGGGGINERDLMGCEIRANLPGYQSTVVNLSGRRMMDNPDVGTLILRRLANVEGLTFSMTSAMAPKDAKKAWEKGKEQLKKNKLAEAQKELEKAVQLYPKYAVAWYDLGTVHQQNKNFDGARKAYAESLNADSKYVMPHLQLAVLALNEQKWEEVADATEKVIKLNPVSFPQAFFFNSIANYNLQRYDEALESAQQAVKLDQKHQWPKAQHVLGVLLAMKGDNQAALENMRGYLKFSPRAGDADNVRQQISDIEARLSGGAAPANNQER